MPALACRWPELTRGETDMKVLITGGAGFLGSHLCDAFVGRGDQVTCLDTGSTRKVEHLLPQGNFRYVHDSVLNAPMVDALVAKADLVYHLAAVVQRV